MMRQSLTARRRVGFYEELHGAEPCPLPDYLVPCDTCTQVNYCRTAFNHEAEDCAYYTRRRRAAGCGD